MDHTRPAPSHGLFSGLAGVGQPTLAQKINCSVRQRGPHVGGHYLNDGPKLSLAESDFLFCPFCLSNIDDRPSELEVIGSGSQRSRQNSNILDAIVGKEQTILAIDGAAAGRSSFYELKHQITILRVNAFHDHIKRDLGRRIVFEDAVGFIRPDMLFAAWSPTKAACVTQPLGFRQIGFATPEFLSKDLVLGNVYSAAYDSFQSPVHYNRGTDATNMPEFAVRSHNTLGDIASQTFRNHSLDQRCHEFTIVRMHACQVFIEGRGVFFRIKTVYMKKLTRPVVEPSCRIKNPAAHMAKALRFGQIELISLQQLGARLVFFLGSLAFLNIDAGSKPLDDNSRSEE